MKTKHSIKTDTSNIISGCLIGNLPIKQLVRFILVGILVTMTTSDGFSQGFSSPIQWHHSIYEARTSALGQSTAALNNNATFPANPAVPLENGIFSVSNFLLSTSAIESPTVPNGSKLYSPAVSFSHGNFSYAAMMNHTDFAVQIIPNSLQDASNTLLRFQTGYQLNENFSVGGGLAFNKYRSPVTQSGNQEYGGDATAWSISTGMYYQNQLESDRYYFTPEAGLSIHDLSNGFEYETSGPNADQMPGQLRIGFGLSLSSKNSQFNRSLFGGGVYTGFSKYLARSEAELEGDTIESIQYSSPNGFRALFTTWNQFDRYDGGEITEVSLGEQISLSTGFEVHFLETLFLRYGVVGGADLWIRPENGLGAEIDLYYISFAVTYLNHHSSDLYQWSEQPWDMRYGPHTNATFFQATFRLPVDGRSRDTLLSRLIHR